MGSGYFVSRHVTKYPDPIVSGNLLLQLLIERLIDLKNFLFCHNTTFLVYACKDTAFF